MIRRLLRLLPNDIILQILKTTGGYICMTAAWQSKEWECRFWESERLLQWQRETKITCIWHYNVNHLSLTLPHAISKGECMITTAWEELFGAFFSANNVLSNTKKKSEDGRLVVNAKMMANGFSWRENCEKYCVAFVLVSYLTGI